MRILLVHINKDYGGPVNNLWHLARELDALGHTVGVVLSRPVPDPASVANRFRHHATDVWYVPVERPSRGSAREQAEFARAFPRDYRAMRRLMRRWRPDVVHALTSGELTPLLAAHHLGIPTVAHVRELYHRPRWAVSRLNRLVAHAANVVLPISPAVEAHLRSHGVASSKLQVLGNGIDFERFASAEPAPLRAEYGIPEDAVILGMIGQVAEWKGHREAVRALALLRDRNVHLVCVGEETETARKTGYRAGLEALAAELDVAERLHFAGMRADTERYLHAFDLFTQPSVQPDPYPTTVLEAMAAGVPVLGSPTGGVPFQLARGERGWLLERADGPSLAAAVRAALDDPTERARRVAAGQEFTASIAWPEIARRTVGAYELARWRRASGGRFRRTRRAATLARRMARQPRWGVETLRGFARRRRIPAEPQTPGLERYLVPWQEALAATTGRSADDCEAAAATLRVPQRDPRAPLGQLPASEMLMRVVGTAAALLHPREVVETGVAQGFTSAVLLDTLRRCGGGRLHSIDLPALEVDADAFVGVAVPGDLRATWDLRLGPSRLVLPPLLRELGAIDLFLHDADHTYDSQYEEYTAAWQYLRPGGLLISDDVSNAAFVDFATKAGATPYLVEQPGKRAPVGLMRKP